MVVMSENRSMTMADREIFKDKEKSEETDEKKKKEELSNKATIPPFNLSFSLKHR